MKILLRHATHEQRLEQFAQEQRAALKRLRTRCPECGSVDRREFVYGLVHHEPEGKILAGCVVNRNAPTHHCDRCGHDYIAGRQNLDYAAAWVTY